MRHAHETEEASPTEQRLFLSRYYADGQLWGDFAELATPGDEWSKRDVRVSDLPAANAALSTRDLVLVDTETTWAVCAADTCPGCSESKPVDEPCSSCAGMSGPAPGDDWPDEDTGAQCSKCLHAVQGPPAPYCCSARQALIEALHGDEAMRIRQCPLCHGLGQLSHGLTCDRCKGSGVAL